MVSDINFILKIKTRKHLEKLKKKKKKGNADFPFYKLFIVVFHSVWPVKKPKLKKSILFLS